MPLEIKKLTSSVSAYPGITMSRAPMKRVPTTYGIGLKPIASTASISSAMRIAPISAVMRQPACAAKAIPATKGDISRTLARPPTIPESAPNPKMFNVAQASIAIDAPIAMPRMVRTLTTPHRQRETLGQRPG